jgi:hypothetical protein
MPVALRGKCVPVMTGHVERSLAGPSPQYMSRYGAIKYSENCSHVVVFLEERNIAPQNNIRIPVMVCKLFW